MNYSQLKKILKSKESNSKNFITRLIYLYLMSLVFLWIIPFCESIFIKGNFKFCNHNENSPILDYDQTCKMNENLKKVFQSGNFNLLEKSRYLIDGFGFSCSRNKITIKTIKNFFGSEELFRDERIENMDREDCMAMVISKKCHDQPMVCQEDNCQSIVEPKIKYAWLYELTFTSYHCLSQKLTIKGHQLNVPLFTNGNTDCLPNSLFCQTYEKTFIWIKSILHECPYLLIKEVQLNFTDL